MSFHAAASALSILLLSACGPQRPNLNPPSQPTIGLVDGFHVPLSSEDAARYASYKTPIVVRTPQLSKEGLTQFLLSVTTLPILTLALIEGPDLALARDFAGFVNILIENGNELELPPHELTPPQYAVAQHDMAAAERAGGFRGDIIMGGVYALTDETKAAIRLAVPRCPGCLVGVHLYEISPEDIDWLNGLDADIAITETGSPTNCQHAKLQGQATYLRSLYAAAQQIHRLKYFIIYQAHDGVNDCSNLGTFGILDKPAEEFLK